jgi:hypothetical protein
MGPPPKSVERQGLNVSLAPQRRTQGGLRRLWRDGPADVHLAQTLGGHRYETVDGKPLGISDEAADRIDDRRVPARRPRREQERKGGQPNQAEDQAPLNER